jgi:hypothetical protein
MSNHKLIWPQFPAQVALGANYGISGATMDASTEETIFVGRVNAPDWLSGTKVITGAELLVTSKTNGGGTTTVRVALCDVDLTTGNPARDDGTEDQTVDTAIASIPTPQALWTVTFGSTRTVSKTDLLALRVRFTAYGSGTPALVLGTVGADSTHSMPQVVNIITTTYTQRGSMPSVAFICDDGSRIFFDPSAPPIGETSQWADFNSGSTGTALDSGDERGMLWVPSKAYDLGAFGFWSRHNNAAGDSQLCVYRDTTLLEAMDLDATLAGALNNLQGYFLRPASPIRVNAAENIRIVLKPTSANAVRLYRNRLANALDRICFGDEQDVSWTNRVDGGAWNTPAAADVNFPSLRIYGDEVVSGGGGLLTHPGMAGGMRS